jgi:hypothetical protein
MTSQLGLIEVIRVDTITKENNSINSKCEYDTMLTRNTHDSLNYTTL